MQWVCLFPSIGYLYPGKVCQICAASACSPFSNHGYKQLRWDGGGSEHRQGALLVVIIIKIVDGGIKCVWFSPEELQYFLLSSWGLRECKKEDIYVYIFEQILFSGWSFHRNVRPIRKCHINTSKYSQEEEAPLQNSRNIINMEMNLQPCRWHRSH